MIMVVADEMLHRAIVSAPETFPVRLLQFGWNMRVTILVAIIHVRSPVIFVVPSRAFHTIVESAALNVIEFCGERIPLRRRRRRSLAKLRTFSSH